MTLPALQSIASSSVAEASSERLDTNSERASQLRTEILSGPPLGALDGSLTLLLLKDGIPLPLEFVSIIL